MSLKLVGVVALAGLSAVAAYLFLFRKKEEETIDEEIAEQIKEVSKTTEIDKVEDGFQEIAASTTVKKEITQIGSIEDIPSQPAQPDTEINSFEADGEDLTGKTESLMEWIDRQLKEAESKSRNATPAPESQIIINASPDLNINETDNTLITPEKGNSEESLVSEIKQTKTYKDEDNFTAIEETKDLNKIETDNTVVTPDKEDNSEESMASEIVENNPDLNEDNFTAIEETKEEKDDSLDSIEIIEMTEVENVPTQEETAQSNANQQNESQEIIEPQTNKDDWNEKCTQEENQSIEIIDIKINSEEDREVEAEEINPVQPSAAIFSDSALSINKQENVTYTESVNISIADNNPESLISDISDVNNTAAQTDIENSISAETDDKIDAENDSSEVTIISEVSPDKNGLAVHAEFAESVADLAKNTKIEIESLKDAECIMNSLVDEDSDAEIQLLKESSGKKNSILEDSDLSGNDSDSGSCAESVNTEVTVDEAKSDDSEKEVNGNGEENSKDELNDSIGLMLRPSWQIKKPQKTLSGMDAKLTSI